MGFASLTVFTGIGNEDRNSLSQIRSVLILIYLFILQKHFLQSLQLVIYLNNERHLS